jgi:hypothetical protein
VQALPESAASAVATATTAAVQKCLQSFRTVAAAAAAAQCNSNSTTCLTKQNAAAAAAAAVGTDADMHLHQHPTAAVSSAAVLSSIEETYHCCCYC